MTTLILAGLISLGLHGFLLSQWPSPMVRVPVWHASDTMEVTYLAPSPRAPTRSAPLVGVLEHRPTALTGLLRPPARPSPLLGKQEPGPVVRRGLGPGAGLRRPEQLRPVHRTGTPERWGTVRATPSLLTPDDFAQFRYRRLVRGRLQRTIAYPTGHGAVQGTVRLRLTIARDGRVASATCLQPDAPLFEEAAMAGVTAAVPFPGFPPEVSSPTLTFEFRVAFTPDAEPSISVLGPDA